MIYHSLDIFDVYLSPKLKVFLMDIQPLNEDSGTLFFSHEELLNFAKESNTDNSLINPQFRYSEKRQNVMIDNSNLWRMPYEVVHQDNCFSNGASGSIYDLIKQEYEKQMKEDQE